MMKICSRCGIEKPETDFYFANKAENRRRANCKKCADATSKSWADRNKERRKAIVDECNHRNAEKRYEYRKQYKEKNWEYWIEWRKANLEKSRAYGRKSQQKRRENSRNLVFKHYGDKCTCCGEAERVFLTIDHINNDGAEHRRSLKNMGGSPFFEWLVKNNFPSDFQILCRNCNWGKYANSGICPHQSSRRFNDYPEREYLQVVGSAEHPRNRMVI